MNERDIDILNNILNIAIKLMKQTGSMIQA